VARPDKIGGPDFLAGELDAILRRWSLSVRVDGMVKGFEQGEQECLRLVFLSLLRLPAKPEKFLKARSLEIIAPTRD